MRDYFFPKKKPFYRKVFHSKAEQDLYFQQYRGNEKYVLNVNQEELSFKTLDYKKSRQISCT